MAGVFLFIGLLIDSHFIPRHNQRGLFLPPIISPLHFTPISSHYSNFLPLWYTYISPHHFNALKTPQKRPAFMVVEIYPLPVEILLCLRRHTDAPNLVRKCSHFLVGDTARRGHGHGKTTPVFDRGITASLFGIVIPLSYLCIVMEMARNGHGNQPRQVSSKTQSLTENSVRCCLERIEMMRTRQGKSKARQGKDLPFHNCGRFTVLFGIVIPLSYLCIVELKTNKNYYGYQSKQSVFEDTIRKGHHAVDDI